MKAAVLFDFDGTLARTADVIELSYKSALGNLGVSYNGDLRFTHGASMDKIVVELSECIGQALTLDTFLPMANAAQYELFGVPRDEYREHVAAVAALMDSGIRVAVATSSTKDRALRLLDACGYAFEHVVTSDCVRQKKPHPECFLRASSLVDVEPSRCIVVEDSPIGIEAAYAAGMTPIGIRTQEQDLTGFQSLTVLDDIRQLTPEFVYASLR